MLEKIQNILTMKRGKFVKAFLSLADVYEMQAEATVFKLIFFCARKTF